MKYFFHPVYDQMAQKVLDELSSGTVQIQEDKIREVIRCLNIGCVRSDWMREGEDPEQKIKNSRYVRERNYWICMKKIAGYRKTFL